MKTPYNEPAFPFKEHTTQWVGMTLRDYFMAHAPQTPQPWFEPVMPPAPKVPKASLIEDKAVRDDVLAAEDACSDPLTPEGLEFVRQQREATLAYRDWDVERQKQRYIQWPAAWADAMLAQRGGA